MNRLIIGVAAVIAAVSGLSAEPSANAIRWVDGTWDESGAPKGKLLTDNRGWWGPRVYTDVVGLSKAAKGLLKGQARYTLIRGDYDKKRGKAPWGSGLGRNAVSTNKHLVVEYDFKREMVFTEIDLLSRWGENGEVSVSFSADRKNWSEARNEKLAHGVNRIRFDQSPHGRYLRADILGGTDTSVEALVAWGDAADGDDGVSRLKDVEGGDALMFPGAKGEGIAILPMTTPYVAVAKPEGETPSVSALKMARGEFESRYYAVVNCTKERQTVALAPPDFGSALASELYIGGVLNVQRPPKKLSDWEKHQLATTNRIDGAKGERYDVRPFFAADSVPELGLLRKHLANAVQVAGFPKAVPLKPGEGCVLMLRLKTTDKTPAGTYRATLAAGTAKLPVAVDVVDLTLVGQPWVTYAFGAFTMQFPFETRRRFVRDVERYEECGMTTVSFLPHPGTKEEKFLKDNPQALSVCPDNYWCDPDLVRLCGKGDFYRTNAVMAARFAENVHEYVREFKSLGYPLSRTVMFLRDEPGPKSARGILESALVAKEAEPELRLRCNPCFWLNKLNRHADAKIILDAIDFDLYSRVVDMSVPVTTIARNPKLRDKWYVNRPGRINGTYEHPGMAFNPTSAFWLWDLGLNSWGFYAYSDFNSTNPYDIRQYYYSDMRYTLVFPLENDVAITADYESIRECSETIRLIATLEARGDGEHLKSTKKSFGELGDRTSTRNTQAALKLADYLDFRDKVLEKYSTGR